MLWSGLWFVVGSTMAIFGGHSWLEQDARFSWHMAVAMAGFALVAQSGRHMERADRIRRRHEVRRDLKKARKELRESRREAEGR
jgi:hypothetical protein